MWDNTRPMKGINSIHVMNEGSFTLLLAFAPVRQEVRAAEYLHASPQLPMEGL